MSYLPKPVNTDHITLSDDLLQLTEQIAENVHDVWAASRISEGWNFGPKRNDVLKETPCLVPYSELPEAEKEYDRNTALQTIKLILSLGYSISKEN